MANDRIMAVCRECGGHALLYKYYPSGGYVPWKTADYEAWWLEHLHDHAFGMSVPREALPVLMNERMFYADDNPYRDLPGSLFTKNAAKQAVSDN